MESCFHDVNAQSIKDSASSSFSARFILQPGTVHRLECGIKNSCSLIGLSSFKQEKMECRLGEPDYWRCHSATDVSLDNSVAEAPCAEKTFSPFMIVNLFENIYLKPLKQGLSARCAVELIRLLHTPYGRANSTANGSIQ